MISFFNKHKKSIFIVTTATFLIGIFVGLGGYLTSGGSTRDAVAKVGKHSIPYLKFRLQLNRELENFRQTGADLPEQLENMYKTQVLQKMISDQFLADMAEQYGIKVTDREIAALIQSERAFYTEGKFNVDLYRRAIWAQYHMKPAEFETEQRSKMMGMKFITMVLGSVKVSPEEARAAYAMTGKKEADFAKDEEQFTKYLVRQKGDEVLRLCYKKYIEANPIKVFLDEREKGV